jgi:hypothetical protein
LAFFYMMVKIDFCVREQHMYMIPSLDHMLQNMSQKLIGA